MQTLTKWVYLTRRKTPPIRELLAASGKSSSSWTEPPRRSLPGKCKVRAKGWQRVGLSG